jgi:hypothetical protein
MRKALVVTSLAAALTVIAPATAGQAASTDPSPSTSTRGDQLTGLGTLGDFGTPTAYLAAVGTSRGVAGAFTVTYPDGTYVIGHSTCLTVDGRIAYLAGRIDLSGGPRKTTNAWAKGNYLIVGVQDNGNGQAGETPDKMNFSAGMATDPGCGSHGMATPDFVIVRGNYRVVDGA